MSAYGLHSNLKVSHNSSNSISFHFTSFPETWQHTGVIVFMFFFICVPSLVSPLTFMIMFKVNWSKAVDAERDFSSVRLYVIPLHRSLHHHRPCQSPPNLPKLCNAMSFWLASFTRSSCPQTRKNKEMSMVVIDCAKISAMHEHQEDVNRCCPHSHCYQSRYLCGD